jgi:Arc/MetJ-type ribon-helix-helix transcriptional regulator
MGPPKRIPSWYHFGMSIQIAVRLADDMVEFIDEIVAHGEASSRAQVVSRALERERRRRAAQRDVAIYAAEQPDQDMEAYVRYVSRTPLDDLD